MIPNSALSPILNLNQARTEFNLSRLNKPIDDYSSDNRVNSILFDPHASVYYSNINTLKKSSFWTKSYYCCRKTRRF